MNKSERINSMMLFLNNRNTFNLSDLMERYKISKSTAIRDTQSLGELGMPIYSTPGRAGCYNILPNRILSPIVFNIDEVKALYFAMLTLTAYESTPFHLSVALLKQKFEKCLSPERINELRKIEKVFSLGYVRHNRQCPLLPEILQNTIDERVCRVVYGSQKESVSVQFLEISSSFGQWYAISYDYGTEKVRVLRCDKISEIEPSGRYSAQPLSNLKLSADQLYRDTTATDFEAEVDEKGVDMFTKEHYPSMRLHVEDGKYFIRGFYNHGEEHFISGYLLAYGDRLLSVSPPALKELLLLRLDSMRTHILGL